MTRCSYHLLVASELINRPLITTQEHGSSDADPQYVEHLRNKMHATEQLVTAFMRAAGEVGSAVLKDESYRKYQKSETEVRNIASGIRPRLTSVSVRCIAVGSLPAGRKTETDGEG